MGQPPLWAVHLFKDFLTSSGHFPMRNNPHRPVLFTAAALLLLLLAACIPTTMSALPVQATPSAPATPSVAPPSPTPSVEDLIALIAASDPQARAYDPHSTAYAKFPDALDQLAGMGAGAVDAASYLAHAISFPRQDSYLAAQALMALGPDITATTTGLLLDNLADQRVEVRFASLILLSTIGSRAACAVERIAPLLWDPDAHVRTAAAYALESLTGEDLILEMDRLPTDTLSADSIPADIPEGTAVGAARDWWSQKGSKVNWHPVYGICDP
jgi:hypothetical protein